MTSLWVLLPEYSDLRFRGRKLDLLLSMKSRCENSGKFKCNFLHFNISSGHSRRIVEEQEGVKRILVPLRRPAPLHALLMGLKDSMSLVREVLSERGTVFVALIGTEYVPSLYVLPAYLILKGIFRISKRGKVIFIYDYVDLYLQVFDYNTDLERKIYTAVESILLRISKAFIVASRIIEGYVKGRLKVVTDEKMLIYFPPSVSIRKLSDASGKLRREDIRREIGFSDDDRVLVYVGDIAKEI